MQGKTSYTLLLSIIAVMALALAVMIVLFTTVFNAGPKDPSKETKPPLVERAVPMEERSEYRMYEAGKDPIFSIKSTEDYPNSFLVTSVSIIFDGGKKNKNLEERTLLIDKNLSLLKQQTIKYFMSQTFEELRQEDAMDKAKVALKESFNQIVSSESEDMIIIDVIFEKWIMQ